MRTQSQERCRAGGDCPARPADGAVLSIAGLWDRWEDIERGESVRSCTMIVTGIRS